jgi:hypothetical protein
LKSGDADVRGVLVERLFLPAVLGLVDLANDLTPDEVR